MTLHFLMSGTMNTTLCGKGDLANVIIWGSADGKLYWKMGVDLKCNHKNPYKKKVTGHPQKK
jgi:hypothetical protein